MLGHRPLSQHLTSEHEIGTDLLHPLPGSGEHHDPTVETGVHPTSVSMLGMFQHRKELLGERNDLYRDVKLLADVLGLTSPLTVAVAERGHEVQRLYLNPLIQDQAHRQG